MLFGCFYLQSFTFGVAINLIKINMKNLKIYYSGVSVLTFLYICLISGLYSEWALLEHFAVPADASVVLETKIRFGISENDLLTDEQVAELLSKKVEKQKNLAVFAILLGTVFSLTAVSTIAILLTKLYHLIFKINKKNNDYSY